MSPAVANFLFEAGNLLLLAAALGWVLFKPVRRALDAEREQHDKQREEAQRLRAEAESMTEEIHAERREVEREIEERREQIIAEAEQRASEILEAARQERRAERRALEQELAATRDAETRALAEAVGRLAGGAVRELLEAIDGPSLDEALVRAACDKLAELPPGALQSAVVESARPLDGGARSLLEDRLGGAYQERVVGELGAGVRVTTPAGQVDATAIAFARLAAREVSRSGEAEDADG